MNATDDDNRQATYAISQMIQLFVRSGSDLSAVEEGRK